MDTTPNRSIDLDDVNNREGGGASSSRYVCCDWLWRRKTRVWDPEMGTPEERTNLVGPDGQPADETGESSTQNQTGANETGQNGQSLLERLQALFCCCGPRGGTEPGEPGQTDTTSPALPKSDEEKFVDLLEKYVADFSLSGEREQVLKEIRARAADTSYESLYYNTKKEFFRGNPDEPIEKHDVEYYIKEHDFQAQRYGFHLREAEKLCCGYLKGLYLWWHSKELQEIDLELSNRFIDAKYERWEEIEKKAVKDAMFQTLKSFGLSDWKEDLGLATMVVKHLTYTYKMIEASAASMATTEKEFLKEERQTLWNKLTSLRGQELTGFFDEELGQFTSEVEGNDTKNLFPLLNAMIARSGNVPSEQSPNKKKGVATEGKDLFEDDYATRAKRLADDILKPFKERDFSRVRISQTDPTDPGDLDQRDLTPDEQKVFDHLKKAIALSKENEKLKERLELEIKRKSSRKGQDDWYYQYRTKELLDSGENPDPKHLWHFLMVHRLYKERYANWGNIGSGYKLQELVI